MAGPGSWGPPPRGHGQGYGGPQGYGTPQGHGGPQGYGAPQGYGRPPGHGPEYGPPGPPSGPPRPPYGPGYGRPPYAAPGYGYAPPPRRRGGGGVRAIGVLGLLAIVGVGGAMALKLTGRPAYTPVRPPVSAPTAPSQSAADSPLYKVGRLPSAGCQGRQITQGDPASFRAFLDGTTDCLDKEWGEGFAHAGLKFTAPTRVFWSTPGSSPCGTYPSPGVAAFYCPSNASIYIGVTDAQKAAGGMPVRYNVAYAREVAHEYGHAIQDQTGILDYSQRARSEATTTEGRNAVTKRSELQAQCLSGVFMSSVKGTFPVTPEQWAVALRDSYERGDDGRPADQRDHGTDAHYRGWVQLGYNHGTTSACNTWAASPTAVN
ncbi:neutral zinc metallopeptidase [Actinoallomurus soli]|uniref:neutral zinc metallopeptidase n=1 Tax=Actinoallomurus soli TaxID=2952535 RepID=UPI00273A7010|nr:neutral zinc metallopeptidase [Actinoallomurus soli]